MGCWNATDLVTQLPIMYGESVQLFVLKSTNAIYRSFGLGKQFSIESGGVCHANAFCTPIGLPIAGKYNDYGIIEHVVPSYKNQLMIDYLEAQEKYPEWEREINRQGEKTQLEKLIRLLERGMIKDHSMVMVLDETYKSTIEIFGKQRHWDKKTMRVRMSDEINNYLEERKKYHEVYGIHDYAHLGKRLFEGAEWCFRNVEEYLNTLQKDNDIKNILGDVLSMTLFVGFLENTRKLWMVQGGAGSQSQEWTLYKFLAQHIAKHCKEKEKEGL